MSQRTISRIFASSAVVVAAAAALVGCSSDTTAGSDEPATITMWARDYTANQSKLLADAYNETHENQVEVTAVPYTEYVQKVGLAAGANDLPCVLASDVALTPNLIDLGVFLDISDRVNALPYADELTPGHMALTTTDDGIFAVPHTVAMSAIFQNDLVLEQAGIDPAAPIETLEQLKENALKVAALGSDYSGLYFAGNTGGIAFTHFPAIWASGGEALSADGDESLLDSPESAAVFDLFHEIFAEGGSPVTVMDETSATRNDVFATGKVGYVLSSNSVIADVPESDTLKIGVQGMPGLTGGESTFVGGDIVGISSSCDNPDAAWDFVSWTLDEEQQVELLAKNNQLTVRNDLADNVYAQKDPRIVKMNQLVAIGKTPLARTYGQTFTDPNGPALPAFRKALFEGNAAEVFREAKPAIDASLQDY